MNVQEQIKKYITSPNAVTCESCIGSHFNCHQDANYRSSMAKTAKIILFPTLRLDMAYIPQVNGAGFLPGSGLISES